MAKKKNDGDENQKKETQEERTMTPEIQKKIEDLIFQKKAMEGDAEAYKDNTSAVAESLGIKPAALKRRISIIIKEEEVGGELKEKENDLSFSESYFILKDNKKNNS